MLIPITYFTLEALLYASIGAATTYAAIGMIDSSTRAGDLSPSTGQILTDAIGGITGSMINNTLSNFTFPEATYIPQSLCGDQVEFNYIFMRKEGNSERGVKQSPRTEPKDLQEQLALEEAKAKPTNPNDEIMADKIKDPKYPKEQWKKVEHTHKNPDGTVIDIHYWENRFTGEKHDFKFKNN